MVGNGAAETFLERLAAGELSGGLSGMPGTVILPIDHGRAADGGCALVVLLSGNVALLKKRER